MNRLICFTIGLMLALSLSAALKPSDIKVHLLDNGLKVLLLEDHSIPNIAHYTYYRVGSRNERPGLTGVSHFVEHMMFNGTEQFGPGQYDQIMESNGGSNNAFTGNDMTGYTNWFPASALEKMLILDSDRMQGLIFDPTVLESERGVITSERRMAIDNDDESLLDEAVTATAIMAHPYHWGVIGWMSDIQSWPREQIMAYYRTYYAPNNAVLVLVGDFHSQSTLELIHKYYGPIPKGPVPPAVTTVEPEQIGPRRLVLRRQAQTPSLQMVYHVPGIGHADFPSLQILDNILLQGESSRLYRRLVRDEQLAIEIRGGMSETIDPYLFSIAVKPRPGANLERIETVIEEELKKIAQTGVSERELQKAKNGLETRLYSPMQTIAGLAGLIGQCEIFYGGYEQLFKLAERYTPVTLAQVQQVATTYFKPDKKTIGMLIPKGDQR